MRLKKKFPAIVWHVHSNFPIKRTIIRRLKDVLKFQLMGRYIQIFTVSEELRDSVIVRGFSGLIWVVPNCFDISRATRTSKSKTELRRELEISESAIVLLSFGWEPITKGVDLLLEAAEKLSTTAEFILLIIGTAHLREFVVERFGKTLPPWLKISDPRECVADLYNAADIFISASRW